MNKQDIQLLFKYNQWANRRILNAAASLTGEQFLTSASYPHGGLPGTLTHILFAEWIWRRRWEGESPATGMKPEDFPNFEALRKYWLGEESKLMDFVNSCAEGQLDKNLKYKSTKGIVFEDILWHMMAHVVNHGTQHRSETAAMPTELGHSPGDMDMILFLWEGSNV